MKIAMKSAEVLCSLVNHFNQFLGWDLFWDYSRTGTETGEGT